MDTGQALEQWRKVGGGMLKGVLGLLFALVLGVFVYLAHSGYAARAGGADTSAGAPTATPAPVPLSGTPPEPGPDAAGSRSELTMQGLPANNAGTPLPAGDSINPNPPNGVTFGGSGHFQLYRQGDITWRLNTNTGETCIVFATAEEWKQARVRRSACRKPGRS